MSTEQNLEKLNEKLQRRLANLQDREERLKKLCERASRNIGRSYIDWKRHV
jgi:septal ring factor EnvC (AmiA/AmiB activator)